MARTTEYMEARCVPVTESGCWIWEGDVGNHGYGIVYEGRRSKYLAHRVAWELAFGELPAGMLVCHRCDVSTCVNPLHMFLGTNQDNSDDKMRKGRWRGGVRQARQHQPFCINGHQMSGENLGISGAVRWCRECNRAAVRRYKAKLKQR